MVLSEEYLDALAAKAKAHAQRYWGLPVSRPPTPPHIPNSEYGLFTPDGTQDRGAQVQPVQAHVRLDLSALPASPPPEPEPWRPNIGDPGWLEYQLRSRQSSLDRISNLADGPTSLYITAGMVLSMESRILRRGNRETPYLFALDHQGKMAVAVKGSDFGPHILDSSKLLHAYSIARPPSDSLDSSEDDGMMGPPENWAPQLHSLLKRQRAGNAKRKNGKRRETRSKSNGVKK